MTAWQHIWKERWYFIRKLSHCWFLLICIWYTTVKIEGGHMCKNLVINIQYWLWYEFPRCATCTILNLACNCRPYSTCPGFFCAYFNSTLSHCYIFFLFLLRNRCSVVFCWKKSSMADTLTEINENTKMARETALFGQYDTSLVYYQGVIQQIQKYLSAIKDPDRRRKWMQVLVSFINSNSIIVMY